MQQLINFDRIWSLEGQINTCVFPTIRPGYALCSSVYRDGTHFKNGRKAFTQLYCPKIPVSVLASFNRCQLGCWWCLQGFCMPFRELTSFGTELRIAAFRACSFSSHCR